MDIFIKASSSNFGADVGNIFSISADLGNVIPNQITKSELISGKILSVEQSASKLTLSSGGTCTSQVEIIINKDISNCYSVHLTPTPTPTQSGTPTPTPSATTTPTPSATTTPTPSATTTPIPTETPTPTPIPSQQLNAAKIAEIRDGAEYDQFSLSIFGTSMTFILDYTDNDEDGSLIKSATGNSSSESFNFGFIEDLNENLTAFIISNDSDVSYEITGSPSSGYVAKQLNISDIISSNPASPLIDQEPEEEEYLF
jgi:hypothetical protein